MFIGSGILGLAAFSWCYFKLFFTFGRIVYLAEIAWHSADFIGDSYIKL